MLNTFREEHIDALNELNCGNNKTIRRGAKEIVTETYERRS